MKRFSEQLKKQSDSIRLSAAERRDLKDRLVAYMEYHPLPKELAQTSVLPTNELASEPFTLVRINFAQIRNLMGAFAVLTLIIVPSIAEQAVPGDVLYPIKVRFNEEVRSSLTFSPYEKVEWETTRLERRIAEARLLASEGKLTDKVQSEVAAAVKEHSVAAQKEIALMAQTDSDEAALAGISFNAALEVQFEVLESDRAKGIEGAGLDGAVSEARQLASNEDTVRPSYVRLLARLETETTKATEYFNSITDVASQVELSDIERRLADVGRKVNEAVALQSESDEENNAQAVTLLTQALADTRKLISFMTNIDVKENVTVEELVPVTLTEEERLETVIENVKKAREIIALLDDNADLIKAHPLAEKVAYGHDLALKQLAVASSSLSVDMLPTVAGPVLEAYTILSDLESALRQASLNIRKVVKDGETPDVIKEKPAATESASSTPTVTASSSVSAKKPVPPELGV